MRVPAQKAKVNLHGRFEVTFAAKGSYTYSCGGMLVQHYPVRPSLEWIFAIEHAVPCPAAQICVSQKALAFNGQDFND
eukprot:scaffold135934_cov31-Tisochrysis_lutea.AAC.1